MNEEVKKESFFSKYRNDSRYKAKVQLLGGFIFILFLVVWINISSMGFSGYMNEIVNEVKEDNNDNVTLINKIKNNNYSFEIEISKTKENVIDKIVYNGNVNGINKIVNKKHNDILEEYYITNNNYYKKNNEVYNLVNSSDYYSFITESFMDLNTIINYINNAKLDSTTNYEDGKVVKNYSLKLKDIVLNNSDENITISLEEFDDTIIFIIDYTKLYNIYVTDKLDNLTINYKINNFDKAEKIEEPIIK